MSASVVVGIIFIAIAVMTIEGAGYYLDHMNHPQEPTPVLQVPAYLVYSLPASGPLTEIMRSLFDTYDSVDIQVASLIIPASEWPRIKREFNASISHENPDAVGTMWGAEVFLHRSDSLVAVILPNEKDMDRHSDVHSLI